MPARKASGALFCKADFLDVIDKFFHGILPEIITQPWSFLARLPAAFLLTIRSVPVLCGFCSGKWPAFKVE
jgi:hypothetical protein